MENTIKYQIYLGYNDSQTREEYVSEEELIDLITAYFSKHDINFSIVQAKGGYLYEDGNYVMEKTMIITIIGEQGLDIVKLARNLSMYMNQEVALVTKWELDAGYR